MFVGIDIPLWIQVLEDSDRIGTVTEQPMASLAASNYTG